MIQKTLTPGKTRSSRSNRRVPVHAAIVVCCAITLGSCQLLWAQTAPITEDFRQASAAMRAGKLNDAEERFAAIVKQVPTFAEAHFNLRLVHEEQGKLEEPIAVFRRPLPPNPPPR